MADDHDMAKAVVNALKAADEIAAALQAHLVEQHGASPEAGPDNPAFHSVTLLRLARERLGEGLRTLDA